MFMRQFFLFILFTLSFSCCNSCDDCPFHPLEFKSTYQRNQVSSDFSSKLLVTLKKLPLLKIDVEAAENLAIELSSVAYEYRYQPIDTVLASSYNYQIEKICGLYSYVKQLPDGVEKAKQQQLLSHAIERLFEFVDDYATGRSVISLSVAEERNSENANNEHRPRVDYRAKIDAFLQDKIKNDDERRSTWMQMKAAMPQYLQDCTGQPDSISCLENIWQGLMRLNELSS